MELSLHHIKLPNKIVSFLPPPTPKQALIRCNEKIPSVRNRVLRLRMECGKQSINLAVELERELEEIEREGKEWREMVNCRGRTINGGGENGMVELLECLEREAIMGDDEGREPTDYNRRALIFDKSSKVFQALKQLHSQTQTQP